jgi:homoserine O-acetyltransferase
MTRPDTATATASDLLTAKRVLHLAELPLASGAMLRDVAIGFETYGRLNAERDNAVLICHYFSGCSHAAGRYDPADPTPGWWDAVIGPGKAIDTERYYVVAIDALGCVRQDAPHGVTTGPASLDPATGRPYGPDFPPLIVADMVESQRRVLDALGVDRLAAVCGPSLGAMQALEWAATRPQDVDRVIAAIAPAELQAKEMGFYRVMEDAIRLDPRFEAGRYAADAPPVEGLAIALKLMTLLAGGSAVFAAHPGRGTADGPDGEWAMETYLARESRARARTVDANAWIAMLRTNLRWDLGRGRETAAAAIARLGARVLLLPGAGDELLPPDRYHDPLEASLRQAGADVTVHRLPSTHGHLAGLSDIAHAEDAIRTCLDTPLAR